MSTDATISAKQDDGTVKMIHLHFGGDILADLQAHYDTPEKVAALIDLGDLSSFDKSTECPEGHGFDNRIDGYCVAYHRDRGEPWERTRANNYPTLKRALYVASCQHNFYHDGESWGRV